jgi:hypothetical protein
MLFKDGDQVVLDDVVYSQIIRACSDMGEQHVEGKYIKTYLRYTFVRPRVSIRHMHDRITTIYYSKYRFYKKCAYMYVHFRFRHCQ